MEGSVGGISAAESVNPSASTSWMSWGFSSGEDGVGERTTEGMRPWPRRFVGGVSPNDAVSTGVSSAGGSGALVGSQSTPGLTIRLMVSPPWTLYSFSSLASASALPFKRSLWASAGGARGCAAIWLLMEDMESVGDTGMVMENGGLRDLNVTWIVSGANQQESNCQVLQSAMMGR